jgi:hypothetical protein
VGDFDDDIVWKISEEEDFDFHGFMDFLKGVFLWQTRESVVKNMKKVAKRHEFGWRVDGCSGGWVWWDVGEVEVRFGETDVWIGKIWGWILEELRLGSRLRMVWSWTRGWLKLDPASFKVRKDLKLHQEEWRLCWCRSISLQASTYSTVESLFS